MPKEVAATPKGEKGKPPERPPSQLTAAQPTPLQQLKSNVENLPGIIKNAEDGLQHLVKKQWLLPEQTVTCEHLATILLSLVAAQAPCTSTDRISDNVANVIKSVAFLLEEATVTQYAEKIANHLASHPSPHTPTRTDTETTDHIKETLDNLNRTIQEHSENARKANEKIQAIQDSLSQVTTQTATNSHFSYRDALLNGSSSRPPALTPPANIQEAKIQNRLSIEACQTLIEFQTQAEDTQRDSILADANSTGKIKTAINTWLANSEIEDPPPPNSTIRAITQYRNNRLLIETNSRAAAKWLKDNATRVLQPTLGRPVKVLGRLYQVIARFMPVQFQTNDEGIRELEISANLPVDSISHVAWLKNPERRAPSQNFANIKIHCKNAEDANKLILGSGRISHMGSQLRLHKDIRTPGTCNQCQKYGHILPDCKDESPTCAKCGEGHRSMECTTGRTKCTPCGAEGHQTNDAKCPNRIERENAAINKKPEAHTPYYVTDERWTWGFPDGDTPNRIANAERTLHERRMPVINTRQGRIPPQPRGRTIQQSTLINNGFQRLPLLSGTNNTPLGRKAPNDSTPPTPSSFHRDSTSSQRASTSQSVQPTQPANTFQ